MKEGTNERTLGTDSGEIGRGHLLGYKPMNPAGGGGARKEKSFKVWKMKIRERIKVPGFNRITLYCYF